MKDLDKRFKKPKHLTHKIMFESKRLPRKLKKYYKSKLSYNIIKSFDIGVIRWWYTDESYKRFLIKCICYDNNNNI